MLPPPIAQIGQPSAGSYSDKGLIADQRLTLALLTEDVGITQIVMAKLCGNCESHRNSLKSSTKIEFILAA